MRSDPEDARIPGVAALIGVLAAIACFGLRPSSSFMLCLVASFAAGLFLPVSASPTLPKVTLAMLPLISLAGGACVAVSARR
jgi:hypothetical protein